MRSTRPEGVSAPPRHSGSAGKAAAACVKRPAVRRQPASGGERARCRTTVGAGRRAVAVEHAQQRPACAHRAVSAGRGAEEGPGGGGRRRPARLVLERVSLFAPLVHRLLPLVLHPVLRLLSRLPDGVASDALLRTAAGRRPREATRRECGRMTKQRDSYLQLQAHHRPRSSGRACIDGSPRSRLQNHRNSASQQEE